MGGTCSPGSVPPYTDFGISSGRAYFKAQGWVGLENLGELETSWEGAEDHLIKKALTGWGKVRI